MNRGGIALEPDLLVFLPAYDEAASLPQVLAELRAALPTADLLVVDDGSRDGSRFIAEEHGARVISFPENRGLRAAVAAGWDYAYSRGYRRCGRIDADGQHPALELKRLLERLDEDCDVAVGSRFIAAEGYLPYRYLPPRPRRLGTALLRRLLRLRLGTPFSDATSGMYAARASAFPYLAEPYWSGAPEVEGLLRLRRAGLNVCEVAVDMRERAHGESRLQGAVSLRLVLTVISTLFLGQRALKRLRG